MKGFRFIMLAAGAAAMLALGACAGVSSLTAAASPVDQGKALVTAEAGLDAASVALDQAALAGVLKGSAAAAAQTDLHAAQEALTAAKAAYAISDATTTAAQLAAVGNLVTTINGLTKPPT